MYEALGLIAVGIFIGVGALWFGLRKTGRLPGKGGSKGTVGGGGGGASES